MRCRRVRALTDDALDARTVLKEIGPGLLPARVIQERVPVSTRHEFDLREKPYVKVK